MTAPLTVAQIDAYDKLIQANGVGAVKQVYGELYDKGFQYAGWAKGVAKGDSVTGQAALEFLDATALMGYGGQAAKNLSQTQIDKVRISMARQFLSALKVIADRSDGVVNRDVTFAEAKAFHTLAFQENGLAIGNWTLTIPFDLITSKYGPSQAEATWQSLRDTGGEGPYALAESVSLLGSVLSFALNGSDSEVRNKALTWASIVPLRQIAYFLIRYFEGGGTALPWSNSAPPAGTAGREDFQKALLTVVGDYFDLQPSGTSQLFDVAGARLSFDYKQLTTDPAQLRSLPLLAEALAKLDDKSAHFIRSYAQDATGWHIQSGTGALTWSASSSDNQAAVGGANSDSATGGDGHDLLMGLEGADTLQGKAGSDLLVGGDGADQIDGGEGRDYLYGGAGSDTYVFTGDFGNDWINDSDGSGQITVDGQTLSAQNAKKVSANTYKDKSTGWTFFKGDVQTDGTATLVISKEGARNSSITVRNWKSGQMGITLSDTQEEAPTGLSVFKGDQRPLIYGVELIESGSADNTYAWSKVTRDPATGTLQGQAKAEADFADVFYGTDGGDDIQGLGGNDALNGGAGKDKIDGGSGNDLIGGGSGSDTILGGAGNDQILSAHSINVPQRKSPTDKWTVPPEAKSVIISGPTWGVYDLKDKPNEYIITGAGSTLDDQPDYIDGGAGDDRILASRGNDYVNGGDDKDAIKGLAGADLLYGGAGNDSIEGDGTIKPGYLETTAAELHGNDLLDGGAGNDTLVGQGGKDMLFGGDNDDTLWGDSTEENFPVDEHDDDTLDGGSGNDQIIGGGKDDLAYGGAGNDKLWGDDQDDRLAVSAHGDDTLDGGIGDDQLIGGGRDDLLIGDAGKDTLWGDDSSDNVPESAHGKDTLQGGQGDDELVGGGDADELFGGDDNDKLWGDDTGTYKLDVSYHGADYLDGGKGNDQLIGGGKGDTLIGGEGDDSLWGDESGQNLDVAAHGKDYLSGGLGKDRLIGGGEADELHGGADNDIIYGDDVESKVSASAHGNDVLYGDDGLDTLFGGGKDDTLFGGGGNDALWGDDTSKNLGVAAHGKDQLYGGDGADQLIGGGSDDQLFGGDGADVLMGDDVVANVTGSAHGADFLDGGADNDTLFGDGGNDTLMGGSGNDFLAGEHQTSSSPASQASTLQGDDLLMGEDGNDVLLGGEGQDTLDGGSGNDTLVGGSGADEYWFGRGSGVDTAYLESADGAGDTILLQGGLTAADIDLSRTEASLILKIKNTSDQITLNGFFNRNTDVIRFDNGEALQNTSSLASSFFHSTDQSDYLDGYAQSEYMFGGLGGDTIYGNAGNDTLEGGAGYDKLYGGSGNDTYVFGRNDNADEITDSDSSAGNVDTVSFKSGIRPDDVLVRRRDQDLILSVKGSTNDSITVRSHFTSGNANAIERIVFVDAPTVSWDINRIRDLASAPTDSAEQIWGYSGNDSLSGEGGNDSLYGAAGDDTLNGGGGNDILDGGVGNDMYLFGKGDGQDNISSDNDTTAGKRNVVKFKADVVPSEVAMKRSGTDLVLSIAGTADKVTIKNFFYGDDPTNAYNPIQQISFDSGTSWDIATIKTMAITGNDTAQTITGYTGSDVIDAAGGDDTVYGVAGNDVLRGGADNDYLFGDGGDDTLDGGSGNDQLFGGLGNDTFLFGKGDGQDTINSDYDTSAGKFNVLKFKAGVASSEVVVTRSGADLVLSISGTTDKVNVGYFFNGDDPANAYNPIQQVVFANGASWDITTIKAMAITGNDTAQTLTGYTGGDVINAAGGNDTVYGQAGNDTLDGGAGADYLYGGIGDDMLRGGTDNDYVNGGDGADTLDGGSGNDQLAGGLGNDTYLFGKGDGQDTTTSDYDTAAGKLNVLKFKAGVVPSEVVVTRSGTDLVLSISGTTDKVTVGYFFYGDDPANAYSGVQQVAFDNGTNWDITTIKAMAIAGNDTSQTITGYTGGDVINAAGGNDTVYGQAGRDTLDGGAGADSIYGGNGDDVLRGGADDDSVFGGDGDDMLDGGRGNDILWGENGSDTYLFYAGAGNDTIDNRDYLRESSARDVIEFTGGIKPGDLLLERTGWSGYDLLVSLKGTADSLLIIDATLAGGRYSQSIDGFVFDGGLAWDYSAIMKAMSTPTSGDDMLHLSDGSDSVDAGAGNDTIYGWSGDDSITGGAGDDYISGGLGRNTYYYNIGSGHDTITFYDYHSTTDETDKIIFGKGIDPSGLTLAGDRYDLTLRIGTNDSITLPRFFQLYNEDLLFVFDGKTLNPHDIIGLSQETDGDDYIYQSGRDISSGKGNDTIIAHDFDSVTFAGGEGDDVYYVDGWQSVVEREGEGRDRIDTIRSLTLPDNVEDLTLAASAEYAINAIGNKLNNVLTGNAYSNLLRGDAGDDVLFGDRGMDTLEGGLGQDVLYGGVGADTYIYSKGDGYDVIYGQRSEDTLLMKGFKSTDVTFSRRSADIDIAQASSGTNYSILTLVRQAFDGTHEYTGVSQIIFDDKTLTADDIRKAALQGTAGNDTNLRGYASNDTINGFDGNDSLYGEGGDDKLYGGLGNDLLDGGAGTDTMAGGQGDDTYWVDSQLDVVIEDAGSGDDRIFATADNIVLPDHVEALWLQGLVARNGWGNASDNTIFGNTRSNLLGGDEGNDNILAGQGNDLLVGGPGDDQLMGEAGNDTYQMSRGDGHDLIYNNDAAGFDVLSLFDATKEQIWLRRVDDDLIVEVLGNDQAATIGGWYLGQHLRLDQIKLGFSGPALNADKVAALVQAMASLAPPVGGLSTLAQPDQARVQSAIQAAWV